MIHSNKKKLVVLNTHTKVATTIEQKKEMDKILQEYHSVFKSLVGVPAHCQVKHSIDLITGTPLPNEKIYRRSVLENDEIKRQI